MGQAIELQQHLRMWAYWGIGISIGLAGCVAEQVQALPGQSVEEVAAWIQTHPTIEPSSGETLLVRRSDTPAHRFMFEALTTLPIRAAQGGSGLIQMEQISLFDRTNGVSQIRLEDSLHIIYGPEVYNDYEQAQVVYEYPTVEMLNASQNQDAPLLEFLQGEVRQGDRFAYWFETAQTREGIAYNGQISVFLIEDIDKLVLELQRR